MLPPATDTFEARDLAVTSSFFFCEVCNTVCEYGDPLWEEHQRSMKFHKMKRMLLLRCWNCGNVVVDAYAEYSPERNQFWCRNCISQIGYLAFRTETPQLSRSKEITNESQRTEHETKNAVEDHIV